MPDRPTPWDCVARSLHIPYSNGKKADPRRVLRGGSWNNKPEWLRSSARNRNNPDNRNNNLGFRVLRGASPPSMAGVRLLKVSRSVCEGVHDLLSRPRRDGTAE
ncbi:MAG: SUMF1/EgtB/PvdO family nonheme iron enzyme [Gammaproteobacteria bacterium]|nr:SUMF1/EgtB/PvdO family nonheme iron enzyme [Gammaproteobacteria bacterium]